MAISKEDRAFVVGIKYEDITYTLIEQTFCKHYDKEKKKAVEPKISFQEEFMLEQKEWYGINKERIKTNVGQFVVNTVLYGNCPNIQAYLGYVAEPYSKDVIGKTEAKIIEGIIAQKIPSEEFARYLNNIQWFGNAFNAHTSASFSPKTTKILPSIKKRRDELFKQHEEELKGPQGAVKAAQLTDQLLKEAKEELKNDVGMQVYDSGCKPKFGNAYRAMFVSRGPIYNAAENKFDILKDSFIDGMQKEEVPSYANSVINGAYPKAVNTSVAGYETKKLFASYQAVKAGPKGSDCGSKSFREVTVTKKNKDSILKRYYLNGNKLEVLENETLDKLMGKTIKIRSPLYCAAKDGQICNKCLGDMPYIIGIDNVGLTASSVGSGILNLLLKAFHDTTVKTTEINLDKVIL